jgi:hypothetical protein
MTKKKAIEELASHLGCKYGDLKVSGATELTFEVGWEITLSQPKSGVFWVTPSGVQKLS